MIRFTASDLRPVLVEARTHACHLVLVKDQGVYMMTDKTNASDDGLPRLIAYGAGCNPETVPFDDWWERARTGIRRGRLCRISGRRRYRFRSRH
ncbi:DUF3085 domain-containing protein [Burkholderia cenocepacia]|uniref:DUF3085 domain-containing protein n=1 Tax=Burkholderia cenocepacia TaxID=95486 RepID=UPI0027DB571B|nr:DUF3085 domain-containing protein [Burkholderia cenocepacia]